MHNEYKNTFPTSLVIREVKFQTKIHYNLVPKANAMINKMIDNNKTGMEVEQFKIRHCC